MPLPDEDKEYAEDIAAGRRAELPLSTDCVMTLQYFPDFDNISLSFYTKNMPGFTIGLATADWPAVQALISRFQWRGRKQ